MRCFVAVLSFFVLSRPVQAEESQSQNIDKQVQLTPLTLLVVDKASLTAKLQTFPPLPAKPQTLGEFQIAVGKERGDKQKEGDNKTPEGVYFTHKPIDGKRLPRKYGSQAIPINFPNAIDRLQGKTGYGIWLHGVEKNSRVQEANVTEGCVAFFNEDIAALGTWLKPSKAIVVIADNLDGVDMDEGRRVVADLTNQWIRAWQQRDIERYADFYHPNFSHGKGRGRDAYKRYKKAVFSVYKSMSVEMRQVRVIVHPKYAVALMNQYFDGDGRYVSRGRKVVYWQKSPEDKNNWKIVRETFSGRLFDETPYSRDDYSQLLSMRKATQNEPKKQLN